MSDEQDKLKVSLEPPKLFGRKKKAAERAEPPSPADAQRPARPAPEPESRPEAPAEPTPEATPSAGPDPAPQPAPQPEPEPESASDWAPEPDPDPDPAPEVQPEVQPEAVTRVLPEDPVAAPRPAPAPRSEPVEVEPEPVSTAAIEDAEIAAMNDGGPLVTLYRAAALTGLVVGAAMVVLTWLSLRGCEAVRGTSSCGGGPGFLLLVATFALCVLLGAQLLKAFSIPDPGSSSFLAVGLVAVVALLFLIDLLDHWSTLIIVPILSVGAHLASVWVTKTFVDPADE